MDVDIGVAVCMDRSSILLISILNIVSGCQIYLKS